MLAIVKATITLAAGFIRFYGKQNLSPVFVITVWAKLDILATDYIATRNGLL